MGEFILKNLHIYASLTANTVLSSLSISSTSQQVDMHSHISHSSSLSQGSSAVDVQGGLLDSLSDTLLNAFSRVRKPDEKFEGMRERLERLEEGLGGTERVILRSRARHGGEYTLFLERFQKGGQVGPFFNPTHIADALQRLLPPALFLLPNLLKPLVNLVLPFLLFHALVCQLLPLLPLRVHHFLHPMLHQIHLLYPLHCMRLNYLRQIWERNLKIWQRIMKI